jgi:hypothetical protein
MIRDQSSSTNLLRWRAPALNGRPKKLGEMTSLLQIDPFVGSSSIATWKQKKVDYRNYFRKYMKMCDKASSENVGQERNVFPVS